MSAALPVFIGAFVFGYLCGSIPFGLLLTRLTGAGDLRKIGSGNIGATNVLRTGRKGLAIATLALDAFKAWFAVTVVFHFFGPDPTYLAAFGAMLGHAYPIWLKFKGGKAVACGFGVILALSPILVIYCLVLFVGIVALTRFVSLGSIVTAAAAGPLAWYTGHYHLIELYVVIGGLVVLWHHENIARLFKGQENRFQWSRKT